MNHPSHPTVYHLVHYKTPPELQSFGPRFWRVPTCKCFSRWFQPVETSELSYLPQIEITSRSWDMAKYLSTLTTFPCIWKLKINSPKTTRHYSNIYNLHQEKRHWLGLPTVASVHADVWVSLEAGAPVQCREVLGRARVMCAYVCSHT